MAEVKKKDQNTPQDGATVQPGTVITPGSVAPDKPYGTITFEHDGPVQPGSVIAPAGVQPEPVVQTETLAPTPPQAPAPTEPLPEGTIAWTASEFVAHDKSSGWYLMLMVCAAAVSAIIYVISRDIVSVGVVIVAAVILGIYAAHKPRQLGYRLDDQGVTVDQKSYAYGQFKSFSVVEEGAFSSITFMPLKRFSPPLSIYYAPEDEEKIIATLTDRLPFEQARRDAVDSFLRKIRF